MPGLDITQVDETPDADVQEWADADLDAGAQDARWAESSLPASGSLFTNGNYDVSVRFDNDGHAVYSVKNKFDNETITVSNDLDGQAPSDGSQCDGLHLSLRDGTQVRFAAGENGLVNVAIAAGGREQVFQSGEDVAGNVRMLTPLEMDAIKQAGGVNQLLDDQFGEVPATREAVQPSAATAPPPGSSSPGNVPSSGTVPPPGGATPPAGGGVAPPGTGAVPPAGNDPSLDTPEETPPGDDPSMDTPAEIPADDSFDTPKEIPSGDSDKPDEGGKCGEGKAGGTQKPGGTDKTEGTDKADEKEKSEKVDKKEKSEKSHGCGGDGEVSEQVREWLSKFMEVLAKVHDQFEGGGMGGGSQAIAPTGSAQGGSNSNPWPTPSWAERDTTETA